MTKSAKNIKVPPEVQCKWIRSNWKYLKDIYANLRRHDEKLAELEEKLKKLEELTKKGGDSNESRNQT